MPSEKQIAANRHNARKSTGPRSGAGKKRASRNAHTHGLTMSLLGAAVAKQVEKLARKIAGRTKDQIVLEYARTAAQAELDLARVRRVKVSLIDRAFALGTLVPQPLLGSVKDIIRLMKSIERGEAPVFPRPIDHLATMPLPELQRSSEAVRRVLPELIKLERYERHAVAQRDRAIREMNLRCEELLNSLKL